MTPNDIDVLLHYHVSSAAHPRITSSAVQDSIEMLIADEMLVKNEKNGLIDTTARGKAHVRQLCNLPYPTQVFVNAQGEQI